MGKKWTISAHDGYGLSLYFEGEQVAWIGNKRNLNGVEEYAKHIASCLNICDEMESVREEFRDLREGKK